jgi:bifunctional non-homologous end joining protein LigD
VRSRRGSNMTSLLPELEDLLRGLVLDGELVAFNDEGEPHFPLLSQRVLHGDCTIPLRLIGFDRLAVDGVQLLTRTFQQRRERLERSLSRGGPGRSPTPSRTATRFTPLYVSAP